VPLPDVRPLTEADPAPIAGAFAADDDLTLMMTRSLHGPV
jgi:hypothetical protein